MAGKIGWKHIEREQFDAAVEALVTRMTPAGAEVVIPEGRGGDGGVDAQYRFADGARRVFQLKFFPEGMSGGWSKRRTQVKKSWTALKDKTDVREWTLVVPCRLTSGDRSFVTGLAKGSGVEVTFWDRPRLDELFAQQPDLVAFFFERGDYLLERARELNQEKAVLAGGASDLTERMLALWSQAQHLDPYWGVDISIENGVAVHRIVAKPGAEHRDPPQINLGLAFGDEDTMLQERVRQTLGFGGRDRLEIPARNVESFEVVNGPTFLPDPDEIGDIEVLPDPAPTEEPRAAELVLRDRDDRLLATYDGTVTRPGVGFQGRTFVMTLNAAVTVVMRTPHQQHQAGDLELQLDLVGKPVADAVVGAGIDAMLTRTTTLELRISGLPLATMRIADRRPPALTTPASTSRSTGNDSAAGDLRVGTEAAPERASAGADVAAAVAANVEAEGESEEEVHTMQHVLEDLDAISRSLNRQLTVPPTITPQTQGWLRAVRMMLDGLCVFDPGLGTIRMTPTSDITDDDLTKIASEAPMRIEHDGAVLSVGERTIELPTVSIYCPRTHVEGLEEAVADARSAHPNNVSAVVRPAEGERWWWFMTDRVADPSAPLRPLPATPGPYVPGEWVSSPT